MNKKEILEIRKQFKPDNSAITRICGCYVDGDKEIKLTFKEAFGSLTEEEAFKYYEIFRKTLSGTLGKNLMKFFTHFSSCVAVTAEPMLYYICACS